MKEEKYRLFRESQPGVAIVAGWLASVFSCRLNRPVAVAANGPAISCGGGPQKTVSWRRWLNEVLYQWPSANISGSISYGS